MLRILLYLVVACSSAYDEDLVYLDKLNIDPNSVTVSGVMAGGAFASQFHVIHSSRIKGAAIFNGVVYQCASGMPNKALQCMSSPKLTDVHFSTFETNRFVAHGSIDHTSNLIGSKVYVFQGDSANIESKMRGDQIIEFYTAYEANISPYFSVDCAFCQPTDYYGPSCEIVGEDYINNCDYPGSFEALNFLYNNSLNQVDAQFELAPYGLLQFNQDEAHGNLTDASLDSAGYIYVPIKCEASMNNTCKLHFVFHGCTMGRSFIGETFAQYSGYLQVAEANNIIIVFPQAIPTPHSNSNGCWDWWGYTDSTYYATKDGIQNRAIIAMIDRLVGGS